MCIQVITSSEAKTYSQLHRKNVVQKDITYPTRKHVTTKYDRFNERCLRTW